MQLSQIASSLQRGLEAHKKNGHTCTELKYRHEHIMYIIACSNPVLWAQSSTLRALETETLEEIKSIPRLIQLQRDKAKMN